MPERTAHEQTVYWGDEECSGHSLSIVRIRKPADK